MAIYLSLDISNLPNVENGNLILFTNYFLLNTNIRPTICFGVPIVHKVSQNQTYKKYLNSTDSPGIWSVIFKTTLFPLFDLC